MSKRVLISLLFVSSFAIAQGWISKTTVGNIQTTGNTISTINTNGDLTFDMNGSGRPLFADLTATTVPYLDASKKLQSSAVTPTELGYLSGVTSAIQTQINAITGTAITSLTGDVTASGPGAAAATITNLALSKLAATTASRALVSNGSGVITPATTTATEIGYVNGVTSAIQTQIDLKSPLASPTFTGAVGLPDGLVGTPGLAFSADLNTGMYRAGTDDFHLVAGGFSGLEIKKSTGSFANLGMGGSASSSDGIPVSVERSNASAGMYIAVSNTSTSANSYGGIRVIGDNGSSVGSFGAYTDASTVDAFDMRAVLRSDGSAKGVVILAAGAAPNDIKMYAGGGTSADEVARFNDDNSFQFMQQIATPTGASNTIKLYQKSDDRLYMLNDSATEHAVVGIGTTDTLTAKTLTAPAINAANLNFGTATNTNRLLLPTDTTTNLDALTDVEGLLAYDSTQDKPVYNTGAGWTAVGSGTGGGSGINMLAAYNNNAEAGATTNWSETGGGTLAVTSTAANVANGAYAFSFDASAATDYAISDARTIPAGLFGANCLMEFYYKGFDANITAQVHDGTNVIASQVLAASTTYTKTQVNFVCPSSGTLALKLLAGADAAIGYWDEAHLGSATNVGTFGGAIDYGAEVWVDNQANATTSVQIIRNGNTVKLYGITSFSGAMSGATEITIPTAYTPSSTLYPVTDAKGYTFGALQHVDASGVPFDGMVDFSAASTLRLKIYNTSSTYSTQSVTSSTAPFTWASTDSITWEAEYIVTNWTTTPAAALTNSQNWRVDANISGANPDLGTGTDYSAYTGIEDAGLTLTNNTGSGVLTAQVPCSTTVAPSGTTCSSGSESVGVSFTVPRAGDVRACVSFIHSVAIGASGDGTATFQIVETPVSAQTISQEGKTRLQSRIFGVTNLTTHFPHHLCGTFTFASAGQKVLRLFREQDLTATVTFNSVVADASAAHGQRDIHWEVYPIDVQAHAPTLVGSVTSNSTGPERDERAILNLSGTGTVAITSQSGSWISSVSATSSLVTVNFTAGMWSASPTCVVTCRNSAANSFAVIDTDPTTTLFKTACINTSGSAVLSSHIAIRCMGPK